MSILTWECNTRITERKQQPKTCQNYAASMYCTVNLISEVIPSQKSEHVIMDNNYECKSTH